ncbi:MAG: hypothetical protein IT260_13665, partial [Saprospiraceae bacterium]|nr:hypothetical protein [Saprospiraceae bacterium]
MRYLVPPILAFLLLLAYQPLPAQGLDDTEHSTAEVDNLLDKARRALSEGEKYTLANQSLSISRDLRYEGGVARASILLGDICARSNRVEEALQYYLEAEEKLSPGGLPNPFLTSTENLLEVYSGLGDLFFQEKLYDNARRYYNKILRLAPTDYPTLEKAAEACLLDKLTDSAEVVYQPLFQHYQAAGQTAKLVQAYHKLALAYNQQKNPGRGLFYYLAIEDVIENNGGYPSEKAVLYNNLGKQYATLNDYQQAMKYFDRARLLCEYIDCENLEAIYANLGIAMHNTGNTKSGIEYLLKARRLLDGKKDSVSIANLEHLIAGVYFSNREVYNALTHNNEAIRFAKVTKQNDVLANSYRTGADIYYQLYDFEKAYDFYRKYLNLNDTIRTQEQNQQQHVDQQRTLMTAAEGQIKYLIARQSFKDLELQQSHYEQDRLKLLNQNLVLEKKQKEDEVRLLEAQKDADQAKLREQTLQALQAGQQLRLAAQQLDAEKKERLIAGLRQQEQIDRAQRQADSSRVEQLRLDQEFQQREQDNFKKFAYGFGGLGMLILALLALGWLLARRAGRRLATQNRKIEAQKEQIEHERQKSDSLLLNILPDEIAQELRTHGYANPKFYESATVL